MVVQSNLLLAGKIQLLLCGLHRLIYSQNNFLETVRLFSFSKLSELLQKDNEPVFLFYFQIECHIVCLLRQVSAGSLVLPLLVFVLDEQ